MTESELIARRSGVMSTDAANICGVGYGTAYGAYLEKLGLAPPFKPTPEMLWGLRHEPAIAAAYTEETGIDLFPEPHLVWHSKHSWMGAHIDRHTVTGKIVELKTANAWAKDGWGEPGSDQIPDGYNLQVHHQMECLEVDEADIAVLIGGNDFRIYTLKRNEVLLARLIELEAEFWQRVLDRNPPDPDFGHRSTPALLAALYGVDAAREIDLPAEAMALADKYAQFGEMAREHEELKKRVKSELSFMMRDATLGRLADGRTITRKTLNRKGYQVGPTSFVDMRIQKAKGKK